MSGWTAVKQFDFSAEQYASIFHPVIAMYLLMIILLNLLDIILPSSRQSPSFQVDVSTSLTMAQGTRKNNVVIGSIVLLMLPVHDFMFQNFIAVTGQSHLQNPLPLKMGGILFYFTKIFLPLILLSLYFKTRSSLFLLVVVLGYALFVGLTQMSRSSLFMLVLPVLFIHQYRKEYTYVLLSGMCLLFGALILSYIRDLATEIEVFGIIKGQSIISLLYMILPELSNFSFQYESLVNMASRFGGGQDVVLASQYSLDATGGLSANLSRVFLGDLTYARPASWELYDFVPLLGQGVGYGGLTAQLIQVSKGNYLLTLLIVMVFAICLKAFDYLIAKISTRFGNISISYILSIPVLLLLFLYSSFVLLYWYFVFLLSLSILMRVTINYKNQGHRAIGYVDCE